MSARRLLLRLAQVLLLAAIAYGVYRALSNQLGQLGWNDLTRWRPAPLPLAASFALLVAVYVSHAFLWRRIMSDLGIGRPSAYATVRVYFLASLGRYLPGKLWQLAGLAVLAGRAGLPPTAATAAAVLGQFGFLSTGLLFLGVTLPEWGRALDVDAPVALPLALGAALLITGSAVVWLLVATPLGHAARERMAARLGERAGNRVRAAFQLADRVRPEHAALWAAGYALSWVALGAAFVLFVHAFHAPGTGVVRYTAGTVAASYLAGYLLIIVPAGVGAREGAMFLLLQPVMPPGAALVVSVLSRVWFTAAELVPLAVLPFGGTGVTDEAGNGRVEEGKA